jgi:FKBP-type peptidyl-prolyl cis-trans isomerase SlyD
MQRGEMVLITYTGKVVEEGKEFDRGEKVPVIIGEGFVIKGLEEELEKMSVGEEKTVVIPPEKAFGLRKKELIKLLPASTFRERGYKPRAGEIVVFDNGIFGKVISVSGGRVLVDFNHPLAGKELEYRVKVDRVVEDPEEKARYIVDFFFEDMAELEKIENGVARIAVKGVLLERNKKRVVELLKKYCHVREVEFVERM